MTRKTKTRRISPPTPKKLKQAWLYEVDHRDLPTLADGIKAAHPGIEVRNISDVLHFCVDLGRKAVGVQGA